MLTTLLLLAQPAAAEVRLFNGTGQPLIVDVLHESHQQRGIQLPPGKALSPAVGAKLAAGETEMLIVRDASGTELKREHVRTDCIYAINTFSNSVVFTFLGSFQGRPQNGGSLQFLNTTGSPIGYAAELPDFSRREGTGPTPRDPHHIGLTKVPNVGRQGEQRRVTLTVPGAAPYAGDVVVGWPVIVAKVGPALVLTSLQPTP